MVSAPGLRALGRCCTVFFVSNRTEGTTVNTMPWKISGTSDTERRNSGHDGQYGCATRTCDHPGHDFRWDCSVKGCVHGGTALTEKGAERIAARHSATHTETELADAGYGQPISWAVLAAVAIANDRINNSY